MPTYEYACRDCGGHLEVVQSFSDAALTECPTCKGSLRKVFSAAGLIFKGSGWHIKDYAGSGSRTAATAAPGGSASTDGAAGPAAPSGGSAPSTAAPSTTAPSTTAPSTTAAGSTSSKSGSGSAGD